MSVVAIWCRHEGDNIIGIGSKIPWYVPSDLKRFKKFTITKNLVAGRTTYESFPNRTLPNRKIHVLTTNKDYEVSDEENHSVVTKIEKLKKIKEDFYIAGGASVYNEVMKSQTLKPAAIIDAVYMGELEECAGEKIDISESVAIMKRDYKKVSDDVEKDNVVTSIWARKNEFIEQSLLKELLTKLHD